MGKPFIPRLNLLVKSTFAGPKLASTLLYIYDWCIFYNTYVSGPSRSSEKWYVYCAPIEIQFFVPIVPILFVTDICYCHRQFEYRIVHKSMFIYGFRLCCLCLCLRFVHTNISYTLFSLCAYEHIVYFVFPYMYIFIYICSTLRT